MLALSASRVVALLASSSLPLVSATVVVPPACEDDFCLKDLTTCKFSIHFPTSADPKYTSELIHGSFKYNPHKPVTPDVGGYPTGFQIKSLKGERVLFNDKDKKETTFPIVSLIPTVGSPTTLTQYNSAVNSAFGYAFDSQSTQHSDSVRSSTVEIRSECGL